MGQDRNRRLIWRWILAGGGVVLYVAAVILVGGALGPELRDLLSILIVPVALAGVGYLFTWWQKNRDVAVEERRLESARELEQQRAQDEVFQAYLDQLAQPLISGQLHQAGRFDSVRVLARARTVGVLWKLDANRKRSLMQFLHEAKLIRREELDRDGEEEAVNPVIGLSGADLRCAHLRWLDLSKADLRGADLKGANLSEADLRSADLRGADLEGADLRDALLGTAQDPESSDIEGADLRGARGLDQGRLEQAVGDATTKLPKDLERPASWLQQEIE